MSNPGISKGYLHIKKFTHGNSLKNSQTTLYFKVCMTYSCPVDRNSEVGRRCRECTEDTEDWGHDL